jgi:hypothetical protein
MREFNKAELETLRHMMSLAVDGTYIEDDGHTMANRVSVKSVVEFFNGISSDMSIANIRKIITGYPRTTHGQYNISAMIKPLYK